MFTGRESQPLAAHTRTSEAHQPPRGAGGAGEGDTSLGNASIPSQLPPWTPRHTTGGTFLNPLASTFVLPSAHFGDPTATFVSNVVMDARQVVRSWGITFDGRDVMKAEEFITRIGEMKQNTIVTDADLMGALPDLLQGLALKWYRQEGARWTTWGQFETALRDQYGDEEFQDNLRVALKQRTQGDGETIADFIIHYRNLLDHAVPKFSEKVQLDKTFRNLRPECRKQMCRTSFNTFPEMRQQGKLVEATLKACREFESPPRIAKAVLSAGAYEKKDPTPVKESEPQKVANVEVATVQMKTSAPGGRKGGGGNPNPKTKRKGPFVCYKCNREGHPQRNCPEGKPILCYNCGAEGVTAAECPKCKDKLPGNANRDS